MSFLTVGQLPPSAKPQTLEVKYDFEKIMQESGRAPMKPIVPPKAGHKWVLTGNGTKMKPFVWEQQPVKPPTVIPYRPGFVPQKPKTIDVGLKPWYKKPAVIVGMAAGGLAVVGGIIWAMRR